jgi:hypothetical protein
MYGNKMNIDYNELQKFIASLLRADEFTSVIERNRPGLDDALVRASNKDITISVSAEWYVVDDSPARREPDLFDQMESQIPFRTFTKGSPSGLSLGSHSRFSLSKNRGEGLSDVITLYARSTSARVIVQIRPATDGKYLDQKDLARAEKIARLVFGEMSEKGAPTFSLKQAALAQGWQSLTKQNGTILLSRGNQQILIPIGGKKAKIGKNWVTLGGYFSVDRAPESFRPYLTRRS